jgi:bifunctional UDP-N-acetylglucosamine pyrophosphorylase/glucosamine-1-phosphate N-acetyltransferase
MDTLGAIILAAGLGKRMNSVDRNKVTSPIAGKPIILHITQFIKKIGIEKIVVVIGFAKDSVIEALSGVDVIFAEQTERLGTGHAVGVALEKLPSEVTDVFIAYGDDAVFYIDKHIGVFQELFKVHKESGSAVTFLTLEQENPFALGRIIRDETGKVTAIVEEKDATEEERKITEINPGSFVFKVEFLKQYLSELSKSPVTGEYYINNFVDIALKHNLKVETVKGGKLVWRGVNTQEELEEAERLFTNT